MKKLLIGLSVAALVLPGCSRYGFVNLNYPLDPVIELPENIRTIAMVNRSLTPEEDKQGAIMESVVTGEIAGSDKLASDECLKAVYDRLNGRRGISINIPQTTRLYGTGTSVIPELLKWERVKSICDSANSDALLVLETFDSNSDVILSAVTQQVNTVINGGAPQPAPPSQIRMNVVAFWRMYDPASKTIIDQYTSKTYLTFQGVGNNLLLPPPDALPGTAYKAGEEYVSRFLPGSYTVKRDMYKKGKGADKDKFRAAFRRAEVANWEGAINDWKVFVQNNSRNAGKACLNIAVGYEVLGNTKEALVWAKKSYEEYNDNLGREYAKVLLKRQDIEE